MHRMLYTLIVISIILIIPSLYLANEEEKIQQVHKQLCANTKKILLETAKLMQFQYIIEPPLDISVDAVTGEYMKVVSQYSLLDCDPIYVPLQAYEQEAKQCLAKLEANHSTRCDTADWKIKSK